MEIVLDYDYYMQKALEQAKKAYLEDEVPIGCVIVHNGQIIGKGYNKRNGMKNPLYHAEIEAINEASKVIGDWRLEDCILFVTVEPCPMCAGAIVQARIKEVVFGTRNKKAGCCGSVLNILDCDGLNHKVIVTEGIMQEKCSSIMSDFFKQRREKLKQEKNNLKVDL